MERAWITRFQRDVGVAGGYHELWQWSVEDVERFWGALWRWFDVAGEFGSVLGRRTMPGAEWFPGSEVSYPEHVFRDKPDERVAIRFASELRPLSSWTWGELRARVASIREGLRAVGVGKGDCVAAYLPNIPETVAAFLACASLGAVWSAAAPEFGARSVVDRFSQARPKVLLAVDGYRYGGQDFDRRSAVGDIVAGLPTVEHIFMLGYLSGDGWPPDFERDGPLRFERVPFDHPLWILYSSGTTGPPKAIEHGHGGILLEQLKKMHFHLDAHQDDRVFWFTTTGWMMWNFLVGVLLTEASVVLWDGSPAHASPDALWQFAADSGVTVFGTSATYLSSCMKQGVAPAKGRDLSRLRAVGSTGSPLSGDTYRWVYRELDSDTWLFSTSGGTDVCTAFVGGVPTMPVYEGELQAASLGVKLEAWSDTGLPLVNQVGELVITEPMPSMPLRFLADEDGSRLEDAYFSMYPGVWRHGDWIELTDRHTAIIHGRSDATINRAGVRMGTSEIYGAVLREPEVLDALAVDVPQSNGELWMPLFVVLEDDTVLNDELVTRIRARIRAECSPRHLPDEVVQIEAVPRTLSGKALEVPVKRILMGQDADAVASRESLANPDALDWFSDFRRD